MELIVQAAHHLWEIDFNWFIPITAALIGWLTNILAISMMFYPLEFTGLGKIGWQGIIPSHVGKMSAISVDLMVGKLIDLKTIFNKIRPEKISEQSYPFLLPIFKSLIDNVLSEKMPLPWYFLPIDLKEVFLKEISREIPHTIEAIMRDIQDNIETIFDVKAMVTYELEHDKALLNQIFLDCGAKEFRFLERSGLYFGFGFGVLQMLLWYYLQNFSFAWLLLPIGGLLIGYFTNYLALQLIFKPQKPIQIGFWKFQGLFLKRQKAVAATYSKIVATKILTTEKIFDAILNGNKRDLLHEIIQKNVEHAIDKRVGFFRPIIQIIAGLKAYQSMKDTIVQNFQSLLPQVITPSFEYIHDTLDIENTLKEKMSNLSSESFEGFLHPVFQEDELKLILIGAILGMFAGFLQIVFLIK